MPKATLPLDEAIQIISENDLAKLTAAERAEQLEIMLLEGWDENPLWSTVPKEVRAEFAEGEFLEDPSDARYDPVLLLWLKSECIGVRPAYLLERICAFRPEIEHIDGTPVELIACPCCGYRTLNNRALYEICPICWWEDDGQDNKSADKVFGGPNYHVSLTQGRANFLTQGIYDPERTDLRERQHPPEKFVKGREFRLDDAGDAVVEDASGWRGSIRSSGR